MSNLLHILLSLPPKLLAATICGHKNYDNLLPYGSDFGTYYACLVFATYSCEGFSVCTF